MAEDRLNTSERDFLRKVSVSAYANPFSQERAEADQEISGVSKEANAEVRLAATLGRVRTFMETFAKAHGKIGSFRAEDRELVSTAYLFDTFHQFVPDLDALIQAQKKEVKEPCVVSFAGDVLGKLRAAGFALEDASRYFAMFYQIRRAYYFIHVSLIGRSRSMTDLRLSLWNNVFTRDRRIYQDLLWNRMEDFSTLLLGETGSGKGAAAAAIGRSGFIPFDEKSGRFAVSFVSAYIPVNLAEFPETLIESELFGHRKGAFTGALESYEGVFSLCSVHGAIFLDEIGDVPVPVQSKLLRVLQERTFSPVGSHKKQRFNGRVIVATNKPVHQLRRGGLFRDDLFYRLSSDVIIMPSLRQRISEDPGELEDLVGLTVRRTVGVDSPDMVEFVLEMIHKHLPAGYDWPGNVRELEQAVRRILLTHAYEGEPCSVSVDLQSSMIRGIEAGTHTASDLVADYCRLLHGRYGTYEEVARRTGLDRRTVKKYVLRESASETDR